MIRDFQQRDGPDDLDCDLCIVGSGPVGLAIALEFEGSPVRVAVLESGGDAHEPVTEELSAFEVAGHRRVHHSAVRRRIFGGTSSVWSGRCMPFGALDLQWRSWIPDSGWPVQADALGGFLQRAGRLLRAGPAVYDDRIWSLLGERPPPVPWDRSVFETQVFQASAVNHPRTRAIPAPEDAAAGSLGALNHSSVPQAEDLAEATRARLLASRNVTVLLHAHALEVGVGADGASVEAVRIGSASGRRGRVRARHVVLACGAIDNARLLLLSRARHPAGLGNHNDRVGRYLMDHHYAVIATLQGTQGRRLRRRMGHHWLDAGGQRHVVVTGLSLAAQRQREEGLPRATLFTFEHMARPAAITAARQVADSLRAGGAAVDGLTWRAAVLHPLGLARDVSDRYLHHRPPLAPVRGIDIGCNVEQVPDADSRVTLGEAMDAFGQPRARVDWRLDERENMGYRRTAELLAAECARLGLERPRLSQWVREPQADWRAALHDMAHPMGTTRMAGDPRRGVVDAHCAVHGIGGLHVAGSSVFATGGTSNPTLMAVALGLRLADRLKESLLRPGETIAGGTAGVPRIESSATPRVRVGLVGSGPRMRQFHVPVLQALADRFEVVGLTSRGTQGREALAQATGWRAFGSVAALVSEARPEFLLIAVHGEASPAVLFQAMGLGLPLLAETPLSWNERTGRALVATARARGVALGILEQFPFLPAEQLKRKLIALGAIGAVTEAVNDHATYDYHGLAQLRAYAGYDLEPRSVTATRERDGLRATIRMSGGVKLGHHYSAARAMAPGAAAGELRVYGECGGLVGEQAQFIDRAGGEHAAAPFERGATGIFVEHPSLGRVIWENPFAHAPLDEEQCAVALHLDAFRAVARDGGVPLYSAAQALGDVELLRAMHYSAGCGGGEVGLPLRTRQQQARLAAARVVRKLVPAR